MISTRHAQANSPSFPDTRFQPSQPESHLSGWASFLQNDEIDVLKLGELSDDAEDGYIFEVDHHYPTQLHDRCDVYPLAP